MFDLYKPVRNKISQLPRGDSLYVIWAYSQYLQISGFEIPDDIETNKDFLTLDVPQKWISEWELELLAKEVILNCGDYSQKNLTLRSWNTLNSIIKKLKDLENDIYGLYKSKGDIWIELVRIAHRQFVWQENSPNPITTIRYFKIFNTEELLRICFDRTGLTVKKIYICGLGLMGHFLSQPAISNPIKFDIPGMSANRIDHFLSFTCRTISDLKSILKSEQRYDDRFAYAYNSLRAYPLIQMPFRQKDATVCPLPTLLFWRITGGLYYELLDDIRFAQAFGDSFQAYVGDVVKRACSGQTQSLLAEHQYGTKQSRKDSVDWIYFDETSALFLECKAKRLSWRAKETLERNSQLDSDIRNMAKAIVQLYKTISDYKSNKYTHFPFAEDRKIGEVLNLLENRLGCTLA